jgi:hypothetical protein
VTPLNVPPGTPGFDPPRRVLTWRQAVKLAAEAIREWLRARTPRKPPRLPQ